jgi:5S rRNA maturation endonuclease (ribonuclease M5)
VVPLANERERERFKRLLDVIEKLIEENREVPVIVEGMRDERSLRSLGLEGEVLLLNTGEPILDLCERLARAYRRIILMTDWDRKGGVLAEKLRTNLSNSPLTVDPDFRRKLALSVQKGVNSVELLAGYVESKRKEFKL